MTANWVHSVIKSVRLLFLRNKATDELKRLADTYKLQIDVANREEVITVLSALCDLEETEILKPDQMDEYDFWRWVINSMPPLPNR